MILYIYLKDGTNYSVENFKKVTFASGSNLKEVTRANLDDLFITPSHTYRFIGENTLIVQGELISALDFN